MEDEKYFGNYTVFDFYFRITGQGRYLEVRKVKFVPFTFGIVSAGISSNTIPVIKLFFDDMGSSAMHWLSLYLEETQKQADIFFFLNESMPILVLAIQLEQFPYSDFSKEFGLKPEYEASLGEVDFSVFIKKEVRPDDPRLMEIINEHQDFDITIGRFNPQNMRIIRDDIAQIPVKVADVVNQIN